jgi:hypothetical protein
MQALNEVQWLASGGQAGFVALSGWRSELTRQGIRCGHCEGIRPDAIGRLDRVLVGAARPEREAGRVSALWGGYAIRSDLAERIGPAKLRELCISIPMFDKDGILLRDFQFYVERKPRGAWRGGPESRFGLCKECGRLGYSTVGQRYLLRRYWDGSDGITMICGEIVCTGEFARRVVGIAQFSNLEADVFALQDDPADGLPAEYDDMINEIRRRGLLR